MTFIAASGGFQSFLFPEVQITILAVTLLATLRPCLERQVFTSGLYVPGSLPAIHGSDITWYVKQPN